MPSSKPPISANRSARTRVHGAGHGEHVAHGVVLLLVELAALDERHGVARRGRCPRPPGAAGGGRPSATSFGPDDGGVGAVGLLHEDAHGVGRRGDVVVAEQVEGGARRRRRAPRWRPPRSPGCPRSGARRRPGRTGPPGPSPRRRCRRRSRGSTGSGSPGRPGRRSSPRTRARDRARRPRPRRPGPSGRVGGRVRSGGRVLHGWSNGSRASRPPRDHAGGVCEAVSAPCDTSHKRLQ